jgi:dynein heavy chain 2
MFLDTNWPAVRGFMEDAIYGGRIEQQLDIGILHAYLEEYMSAAMVSDSGHGELRPGLRLPRFNKMADCVQFVKTSISDSGKFLTLLISRVHPVF